MIEENMSVVSVNNFYNTLRLRVFKLLIKKEEHYTPLLFPQV